MPKPKKTIDKKIAERNEYLAQFPRQLEVEINRDLTPLQMLLMALIKADIRTVPLMHTCIPGRARNTIYTALDQLRKKGILIVYKNLYWLSETPLEVVAAKSRAYWRSKRNPGGKIPRRYNFTDHEKVKEWLLQMAERQRKWRHPNDTSVNKGMTVQ